MLHTNMAIFKRLQEFPFESFLQARFQDFSKRGARFLETQFFREKDQKNASEGSEKVAIFCRRFKNLAPILLLIIFDPFICQVLLLYVFPSCNNKNSLKHILLNQKC